MQWAELKDPNGDINDINNYIQGSLQSDKPDKHQIGEYWTQNHPNWRQVPDNYTPPDKPLTADEQIAALDAEYQPQFDALTLAWAKASMDGNTTLAASIKADKDALLAEYTTKREAIVNS
jgi:hypothetical protein